MCLSLFASRFSFVQFLPSSELVNFYLKLKADHPALISIEDGFDEKDYEGWTRMTEAFAKAHPDFMIVRSSTRNNGRRT